MPIPKTRRELRELIEASFDKLTVELDSSRRPLGSVMCTDVWNIKGLLAVRAWWGSSVVDWIEAGQRGEVPVLPAAGYRWNETPALNDEIVRSTRRESFRSVRGRLDASCRRALATVARLQDRELLQPCVFAWAGRHPVARWISMNTATQYMSARVLIRRALREVG
tara:strand:- start:1788 stop:2285 length:498 start_codon:yes stop_codon:yes gene_type:complete